MSSPPGGGCATLSDRAGDGVGRDRVPWWASTAADGSDSSLVIVKYQCVSLAEGFSLRLNGRRVS